MRGVRGEEPGSVLRAVGSGLGAAGSRVRAAGSVPRVPGCGREVSAACAASARGYGLPGGGAGKSLWAGTVAAARGALLLGPRAWGMPGRGQAGPLCSLHPGRRPQIGSRGFHGAGSRGCENFTPAGEARSARGCATRTVRPCAFSNVQAVAR